MKPRQPLRQSAAERWQFQQAQTYAWEMRWGTSPGHATTASTQAEGSPHAGRCPEVQGMCNDLSPRGALRLRALLRPARGRLRAARPDAAELKRRIQAGPLNLWRYADFLPLEGPARSRCTPASRRWCAPTASPSASACGEVWVKNETANPTHSFKDRVVSVALARALELGFETIACASTGNLANAVAAHAAAAGLPVLRASSRPTSRRRRSSPPAPTATNVVGVKRQLRRRQPPLHRARRRARRLGVREHQHAPVLRRGLQDARLRDRRAARLGAAGPRRRPDRLRLAVHQGRARLRGVHRARAARGRAADDERRPGRGLLAGRPGLRRRAGLLPPGQAGHDRQVAGDRQPGRRPVRDRAARRAPAAASTR